MFQNLKLRTKLVAIVTPPLFVLAVVAAYAVLLSNGGTTLDELSGDVRTLGVVALAALLLSALSVVVIGRTITDPIDTVSASARELADVRLPALLDTLRHPGRPSPTFEPLVAGSNDEVAELVESLNAVQVGIAGLAEEQRTMVRQGLSELVVNLARRNQSLLDRQIEVIDRLEHEEEDPDRLQELFNLDHLATRMRRNAESLLVVAGAEPARRRGGPVEVADALRVAMSEIEDYRNVKLTNVEDARIGAQSAVDLAHLFSELLENATQFSPPDSPVEVTGVRHPDGSYLISCVDHGIGMTTEQLDAANEVLQRPPELGLGLTRSLGFIVVGRLAARLGVTIELTHTPNGGVTAIADIPSSVLADSNLPVSESPTTFEPPETDLTEEPPAPTPAVDAGMAAAALAIDTPEESWTPPAMPERDATAFAPARDAEPMEAIDPTAPAFADGPLPGHAAPADASPFEDPAPAAEAPAPAPAPPTPPPAIPEPTVSDGAHAAAAPTNLTPGSEAPASEALAKLLGIAPTDFDTPPAPAPAPPMPPSDPTGDGSSTNFFARPRPAAPAPEAETPWEAPAVSDTPPEKLADAIPTGESFESGMESLLAPDSSRTSAGLVKRDRTKNHAPESEGRRVASSVRSPEEIRSMLSRYRSGLKGKPLEDMATPPMPDTPPNTDHTDHNGEL